ncbi:MAG TPA: hypothetical protein VFQ80_08805, partial [Thermomicrobiales bacterium]|nr:hypothetical protein [Thermomicrobiales bacterium]
MESQARLRQAIDRAAMDLRLAVPSDRPAATAALIRASARLPAGPAIEPEPDLVTGRRRADLGVNKALQLALEAEVDRAAAPDLAVNRLDGWADDFLAACGRLAEAEMALAHCETGFMGLVDAGGGTFDAWIASRRAPTIWRERADVDWWAAFLARRHEPELRVIRASLAELDRNDRERMTAYERLAGVNLQMMSYQFGYPPDAAIGGFPVRIYRDVLRRLVAAALAARDHGEDALPHSESALVAAVATDLDLDLAVAAQAVAAFTLDRANAAYHAAVPGVAAAPLVRLGPDRLVWSTRGLTTEPFFFLTRELRRENAAAYHNAAYLREGVFRQDLYALFADRRFVTSAGRVALRREGGAVRTDIDAVVFDRKTGALGIFELKSTDPFARSTA